MKAPVRISYARTEACLLEGRGRDVSQADRGWGTFGFEEADTDRDHCGEAGDLRIRIHGWT